MSRTPPRQGSGASRGSGLSDAAQRADVLVIGGGPAGASAAATLARRGRHVVLLEKAAGDRYRVGESLLPYCWFTLERIGALDAVKAAGFQQKQCVQFISPRGRRARPYYFADHLPHEAATTWQVPRPAFDRLLLDNCRAQGVEVHSGASARRLVEDARGAVTGALVEAQGGDRSGGATYEIHAPITIDATGRDGLAVGQRRWRVSEPALDRVAVWAYFEGAERDPGREEGATTIARLPEDGWIWLLPLAGDRMSVGVVQRAESLFAPGQPRDPLVAFERAVGSNPWVAQRLAPARRTTELRVTRNFSYRSQHCAADGLLLAGDAVGFLDPVFSPGVFVALASGEQAAWAADAALTVGRADGAAFEGYAEWLARALEPMRRLIFAFYDQDFSFATLFGRHPELRPDLTDCLIGNLDRDYGALFAAMAELTPAPPTLSVGGVAPPRGG